MTKLGIVEPGAAIEGVYVASAAYIAASGGKLTAQNNTVKETILFDTRDKPATVHSYVYQNGSGDIIVAPQDRDADLTAVPSTSATQTTEIHPISGPRHGDPDTAGVITLPAADNVVSLQVVQATKIGDGGDIVIADDTGGTSIVPVHSGNQFEDNGSYFERANAGETLGQRTISYLAGTVFTLNALKIKA